MESVLSDRKAGANILASALVLVLSAILAAALYPQLRQYWAASPFLNSVIIAFFLAGACYVGYWMLYLQQEFRVLEIVQKRCGPGGDTKWLDDDFVMLLPHSLVRERLLLYFEQIDRNAPPNGENHSDRVGLSLAMHTSLTRYMSGVLVFLGLLGTFIGLLQAIGAIEQILVHLPTGGLTDQSGAFFNVLKQGLSTPLHGMATAFSTSLFGLVTSLVLGFFHVQLVSAQTRYISRLETLDSAVFQPSFTTKLGVAGSSLSSTAQLDASHGRLTENLDRLMTIVERTEGMQANFRDVMMTIGRQTEVTNAAIARLTANQDLIRASLSSTVDLLRADGETQRLALAEMRGVNEAMGRLNANHKEHQVASRELRDDVARMIRSETGAFVQPPSKGTGSESEVSQHPAPHTPGLYNQK